MNIWDKIKKFFFPPKINNAFKEIKKSKYNYTVERIYNKSIVEKIHNKYIWELEPIVDEYAELGHELTISIFELEYVEWLIANVKCKKCDRMAQFKCRTNWKNDKWGLETINNNYWYDLYKFDVLMKNKSCELCIAENNIRDILE